MTQIPGRYRLPRLRQTLEAQGRHQRWVARKVGISDSLLSKAQTGERTVPFEVAKEVADLLGVPFGMLCELHEGPQSGLMEQSA